MINLDVSRRREMLAPIYEKLPASSVLVVGLGMRTHVALTRYLASLDCRITINDRKPESELQEEIGLVEHLSPRLVTGGHPMELAKGFDYVFVSYGVSPELPLIRASDDNGATISNEIELLFSVSEAPIAGITGSAGKTTTTTLVGEMLRAAGADALVGGNIGLPLIDKLPGKRPDWLVLELSSFQLELVRASVEIGAILNVTPNHLDRHHTFQAYAQSKFNLLRFQDLDGRAVLGAEDPACRQLAAGCTGWVDWFGLGNAFTDGAYLDDGWLKLVVDGGSETICHQSDLRLLGEHNQLNALAASVVATRAGCPVTAIRDVLTSFAGVEHRLELVREVDDVCYYNDSIATSPERTVAALKSLDRPVVLLAGGRSKHLPIDEMLEWILRKCVAVFGFGELGSEIVEAIDAIGNSAPPARATTSMSEAFGLARETARPQQAVLLSPAGTSFDAFRDFEERGQVFKSLVNAL